MLLTLIVSSKAARINVPINHTIRLTLHLYLIPMIFSGILMILNLLSMYFFGIFSGECTLIIPVAGWTWFTAACALGMQTIGEISLKKALCIVLPAFIIVLVICLYDYISMLNSINEIQSYLNQLLLGG